MVEYIGGFDDDQEFEAPNRSIFTYKNRDRIKMNVMNLLASKDIKEGIIDIEYKTGFNYRGWRATVELFGEIYITELEAGLYYPKEWAEIIIEPIKIKHSGYFI